MSQTEASPIHSHVLFLQLCRAVSGGCFVEAVSSKSLKRILCNCPTYWSGCDWENHEPIIQTRSRLSADQLFKRWRSIRNLMQLAHPGELGGACDFRTHILHSGCFNTCSAPSLACLPFALMTTACERSNRIKRARERG